jgi:hypothetical protein
MSLKYRCIFLKGTPYFPQISIRILPPSGLFLVADYNDDFEDFVDNKCYLSLRIQLGAAAKAD